MLLDLDSIGDSKILTGVLDNFGITLKKNPPLPISIKGLVDFLIAERVSVDAVNALIGHLNDNITLFGPAGRDRFDAHVWPDQTRNPNRSVSGELFWSRRDAIVTRQSKIVSLGSCFAIEVAKWLQLNGYNYIVKEPNYVDGTNVHASSARWGTIFNAVGFYQVVNWAFGMDQPPLVAYRLGDQIRDPFREDVFYSEDELPHLARLWQEHTACARAALQAADIVVLTVGLNEVFRYLPTGHYLHRTPWGMNPALWTPEVLTVEDNVEFLKTAIQRLRAFNPKVQVIISVSPVPLLRSFRRDVHVAVATAHSKAVLRVALEELCATVSGVHYMASFETVMYPGEEIDPWVTDERHVSEEIVAKVMRLFQQQFCSIGDGLEAARNSVSGTNHGVNPTFEIDHKIVSRATSECVERGLMNPAQALDMVNACTNALHKDEFDERAYSLIRARSIESRFAFNLLCRQQYRAAFPTTFANTAQSATIHKGLSEEGYHVIAATSASRQFATDVMAALESVPTERDVDGKVGLFRDLVAENVPGGFRFHVAEEHIPVAQAIGLMEKMGVLHAIGLDLGHPILRHAILWYSVRPSEFVLEDQIRAAQLYHADNDTPTGWVKVFVYLTDVSEENGPHIFVPRSHREWPRELARDGRFSDEEVESHFGPGQKVTGPAGTVIVENSQGMHKAMTVRSGVRAILQVECVNSLLGQITYRHPGADRVLRELAQYDSRFLRRYLRDNHGL